MERFQHPDTGREVEGTRLKPGEFVEATDLFPSLLHREWVPVGERQSGRQLPAGPLVVRPVQHS